MTYDDEEEKYKALYADEKYKVLSLSSVVLSGQLKPFASIEEMLAQQRQAAARLKCTSSNLI